MSESILSCVGHISVFSYHVHDDNSHHLVIGNYVNMSSSALRKMASTGDVTALSSFYHNAPRSRWIGRDAQDAIMADAAAFTVTTPSPSPQSVSSPSASLPAVSPSPSPSPVSDNSDDKESKRDASSSSSSRATAPLYDDHDALKRVCDYVIANDIIAPRRQPSLVPIIPFLFNVNE